VATSLSPLQSSSEFIMNCALYDFVYAVLSVIFFATSFLAILFVCVRLMLCADLVFPGCVLTRDVASGLPLQPVQKCMNSCMDSVKKFTDQIMGKAPEQKEFDDIKQGAPPPQMDMGPAKPPQVIKPDAPTILVPPPKPAGPGTPAPRPATNPNDPRPEGR
jgi:hypothetical protein